MGPDGQGLPGCHASWERLALLRRLLQRLLRPVNPDNRPPWQDAMDRRDWPEADRIKRETFDRIRQRHVIHHAQDCRRLSKPFNPEYAQRMLRNDLSD